MVRLFPEEVTALEGATIDQLPALYPMGSMKTVRCAGL